MVTKTSFNLDNRIRSKIISISKKNNIDESKLVNIFFTKIFEIWENKFIDNSYKNDFQNINCCDNGINLDFISLDDLSKDDLILLEKSKNSKNRINI